METKANQELTEEFEPLCKWQREEDQDILQVHLREFRKDQLRVQISNLGVLKISGERPLDGSRKSRFYKEVPAPSHKYDNSAIRAKFLNEWLVITLPKKKPPESEVPKLSADPAHKIAPTPKPESTPKDDRSKSPPLRPSPRAKEVRGRASTERALWGLRCLRLAKLAMTLAATVAAMAVFVACVVYIYRSTMGKADGRRL